MISYIHIVIFAASATVAFCRGFCENGKIIKLNCPVKSLITGIQTTSKLFSEDATPLCSDMAGELELDYSVEHYHYKNPDAVGVEIPRLHKSLYFSQPKLFCADRDFAVQNISMCSEGGGITEVVITCRGLMDIPKSSTHNTVTGTPGSRELKCRGGSALNSLEYDQDNEDNLIAIAKCVQAKVPSAVQNCIVVEKTNFSVRISCYKSPDEGVKPSFLAEIYSPRSPTPTNISSQSPDFLVRGLAPGTEYNLKVYAVNFKGRSPPLAVKASTLSNPKRRTGAEGCEAGTLVEIECPDGYIVTGVHSKYQFFLSPDMHPLCSKRADKLILNPTDPTIPTSISKIYPREEEDKFLQVECSEAAPVVLKFSMCFVDGKIWRSVTQCRPFQDNATVTAYYTIEGRLDSPVLKCPQGSFLNSIKMGWDQNGREVIIPAKCTVIEE